MAGQLSDPNSDARPEDFAEDAEGEDFIDTNEIDEVVDADGGFNPDDEMDEDDYDGEGMEDEGDRIHVGEDGQMELQDDSVQGFFEHKEPVYSVAVHPMDEDIVASGGGDDKAYLWRMSNGEKICNLKGHNDSVIAVAFSANGEYVASGGMDGKIHVQKCPSGEFVTTLEGPSEIMWITWHPRGPVLVAGGNDALTWMWAIPSGKCMNVFSGHIDQVSCGQFSPDGKLLVTGSDDGLLISWDPKTAAANFKLGGGNDTRFHSAAITSLAINKDSTVVITGSQDTTAKLSHLHTGKIIGSLELHNDVVESVDFSDTHPYAATGGIDNKIGIWDISTMKARHVFEHEDAVVKVKFHSTQPILYSCSQDSTVRLWDIRTGSVQHVFHGHQQGVLAFDFAKNSGKVVSGSDDGTALVFAI